MRRETFINGNFYHIYNRGVDKRKIFLDERDHARFLIALYLFNDVSLHDYDLTKLDLRGLASYSDKRIRLVDIIQWCQMPNHYHLLLRQLIENGISMFMQRVGTSFSMYFNKKHERSGRFFEGPFKAKFVEKDEYFSHLSTYIPLNAVDLYWPDWKDKGIPSKNLQLVKNRLSYYRWSSFKEYFTKKDVLPNFLSKDGFYGIFGGSNKDYEKLIDHYLLQGLPQKHKSELLIYEAKPRSSKPRSSKTS